jgi:hypothetical protein
LQEGQNIERVGYHAKITSHLISWITKEGWRLTEREKRFIPTKLNIKFRVNPLPLAPMLSKVESSTPKVSVILSGHINTVHSPMIK